MGLKLLDRVQCLLRVVQLIVHLLESPPPGGALFHQENQCFRLMTLLDPRSSDYIVSDYRRTSTTGYYHLWTASVCHTYCMLVSLPSKEMLSKTNATMVYACCFHCRIMGYLLTLQLTSVKVM